MYLNAIGLTPVSSSTVHIMHRRHTEQYSTHLHTDSTQNSAAHIYTQTAHRTVQYTFTHRQYTEQCCTHLHTDSTQNNTVEKNTQNRTYITMRIREYNNKNT